MGCIASRFERFCSEHWVTLAALQRPSFPPAISAVPELQGIQTRVARRGLRMHRHVRWCQTLFLALLVCTTGFSTLAYATPPDQIWIPGIYDAADFDDVVWILTELYVSGEVPAPCIAAAPQACGAAPDAIGWNVGSLVGLPGRPRSPPLL